MAEESHIHDRIWQAIDQQRAHALRKLDAVAAYALGDLFQRGTAGADHDLARMLARDLTALGMVVHDSSASVPTGGVWLAPCMGHPGVIVAWTQHAASAAVLGPALHRDLQETMNFDLHEILRILGYPVKSYGGGRSHIVTGPRI